MTDWIIPFLCGLGASILSAWGVGGGTLLLLVMTLFLDVDRAVLRSAAPWGTAAAAAGALAATAVDTDLLRRPFGIYLLLAAGSLLLRTKKTGKT